jgi:hypothetical protein
VRTWEWKKLPRSGFVQQLIFDGGRSLLQGRGAALHTLETEGQMLQRVMPDLMGLKNILVINDEAHHCYREKPGPADDGELKGDDRKEAEKNNEAAHARARAEHTTLNEQFRHWLADYVCHWERLQRYDQVIGALRGKVRVGRKLTRDEMHER